MFNRGAFNRMPFNRSFSVEILFSAVLQGEGGLIANPNVEYLATVTLEGEGELFASYIREYLVSAVLQGEGSLTAISIRERLFSALLQGEGELKVAASRFHIDEIDVLGPFAPGDKIVIDSAKLRVTKNGSAIGYEGEFFNLNPGGNHIVYTDTATGRTVQIRITHRDRFI
jgi:Phage-related protein